MTEELVCLQCRRIFCSKQRRRSHNCGDIKKEIKTTKIAVEKKLDIEQRKATVLGDLDATYTSDEEASLKIMVGEGQLVCILDCSRTFSNQGDLDDHLAAGDHDGALFFSCSGCPKKFVSTKAMKEHTCHRVQERNKEVEVMQSSNSRTENANFKEPEVTSGRIFAQYPANMTVLSNSGCTVSPDKKTKNGKIMGGGYICKCDASFPSEILLRRHKMTVHQLNKSTRMKQKCSQCDYEADQYQMKSHMSKHSNEKNFVCTECGKKFKRRASLNPHMLMHSGTKIYNCEHCGNEFYSRPALKNHIDNKHNMTGLYACNICQQDCHNKYSLEEHMGKHTGERKYACREVGCSKRFRLTSVRMRHEKVHRGIRDYECEKCGKKFIQKTGLVTHMKRHNGVKEHSCATCGKAFVEPAGARNCKHMGAGLMRRHPDVNNRILV